MCLLHALHVLSSLQVVEHCLVEYSEEEVCVVFSYAHRRLDPESLEKNR